MKLSMFFILVLGCPLLAQEQQSPAALASGENVPPASLEVDAGGVTVKVSGEAPRRLAGLAELAREYPGLRGEFVVLRPRDPVGDANRITPRRAERRGVPVTINSGEVPALELVRFLADFTGLTVVHDSRDRFLEELKVRIPASIGQADDEIVKAILEANQVRVEERKLPSGQTVLALSSTRQAAVAGVPREKPIILVDESGNGRAAAGARRARRIAATEPGGRHGGLILDAVPDILLAHLDLPRGVGLIVRKVDDGSGRQGSDVPSLKLYDVITHVADTRIHSIEEYRRALGRILPGGVYHLRIIRNGLTRILRLER